MKKKGKNMIEQNMTSSGFGPVMEVVGFSYVDGFNPEEARVFFPKGWDFQKKRFHSPVEEVCRFQKFAPGGPGRAQYILHPFAEWKSAKVVSEDGPGNIADRARSVI
jgi:hypothetical protein